MKITEDFKFLLFVIIVSIYFTFSLCEVSKEVIELPAVDAYIAASLRANPKDRDDIFDAIEHYRTVLHKVLRIVLHHDRWKMEDASYVYNLGKPKFLYEPIDMKTLRDKFDWYPGHFGALVLLKSEIEQFWDEFVQRYEVLKQVYNLK